MYNFSQIWFIFLFDFNIAKMHIFFSFLKKITVISEPILKKLLHLRFWYGGAGFKTEAQKFFNARTMHQKDDLGNAF